MTLCTAHRTNGTPCRAWAIRGGRVCVVHGGAASQVKAAAAERLRALEHPAISRLAHLIDHADTDATRLAAARWLLEVLGHKPTLQVEAEQEITIRLIDETLPTGFLTPAHHNGHAREPA